MLRPRDTPTRERKSLNGLWRFRLDSDADWREAPVPASYNDLFADAAVRDHVGDAWYQTAVRVPRGWAGERIVLRFDAATHRAVVWVDDERVAEHEGGYTPFEADVTDARPPGEEHAHHRRREQRAHLALDPARASSRTRRTAAASATSTTSSTTPACTAPVWLYATPRGATSTTSRS